MGGIHRPSQGLKHLQPCTDNHLTGKICAPPRLCPEIKHMYDKNVVKIIIEKTETSISLKLGVKQGYRMAPLLFMFLMMAFAKTLEDEWAALGLSKYQFARKDN